MNLQVELGRNHLIPSPCPSPCGRGDLVALALRRGSPLPQGEGQGDGIR